MSTLCEAYHALMLAKQEEKTAAWERQRNARKLREGLLHETALRLMKVRRSVDGRARFDVPSEWLALVKDGHVEPGWKAGSFVKVTRWQIIEDFALNGASLQKIECWYRLEHGTAETVIRDALAFLESMEKAA